MSTMEEVFTRFPHIGQGVFELLEDKMLLKLKNVSKTWRTHIPKEKWMRIISSIIFNLSNKWKDFFDTCNSEMIREIATNVYWFSFAETFDNLHFIPKFDENGRAESYLIERLFEKKRMKSIP